MKPEGTAGNIFFSVEVEVTSELPSDRAGGDPSTVGLRGGEFLKGSDWSIRVGGGPNEPSSENGLKGPLIRFSQERSLHGLVTTIVMLADRRGGGRVIGVVLVRGKAGRRIIIWNMFSGRGGWCSRHLSVPGCRGKNGPRKGCMAMRGKRADGWHGEVVEEVESS